MVAVGFSLGFRTRLLGSQVIAVLSLLACGLSMGLPLGCPQCLDKSEPRGQVAQSHSESSSFSKSSTVHSNIAAICFSLSNLGSVVPVSHMEIADWTTPSLSASSFCVRRCAFRICLMLIPVTPLSKISVKLIDNR